MARAHEIATRRVVKNAAILPKHLNRDDVLVTEQRLCTGLSPGSGDESRFASINSGVVTMWTFARVAADKVVTL
jgi:hypothetical protein